MQANEQDKNQLKEFKEEWLKAFNQEGERPVKFTGYMDLFCCVKAILNACKDTLLAIESNSSNESNYIDLYNLIDLADKLMPYNDFEVLEKIKFGKAIN